MPDSDDEDLENEFDDEFEGDDGDFDESGEVVSPSTRKRRKETADGPQKRRRTEDDVSFCLHSISFRVNYHTCVLATQDHCGGMGSMSTKA
jgi:hypothetical protein